VPFMKSLASWANATGRVSAVARRRVRIASLEYLDICSIPEIIVDSICSAGCPITLVSNYTDTQTPANSYSTGITFNLSLKATDTTNGFSLNNFYSGVEAGGFVFGNTGTSSKLDAGLSNVTLGTTGQSNATVFNGVQNGPIGNIGAVGASVKDLKVKISGM